MNISLMVTFRSHDGVSCFALALFLVYQRQMLLTKSITYSLEGGFPTVSSDFHPSIKKEAQDYLAHPRNITYNKPYNELEQSFSYFSTNYPPFEKEWSLVYTKKVGA